jgi:hypothetical protein
LHLYFKAFLCTSSSFHFSAGHHSPQKFVVVEVVFEYSLRRHLELGKTVMPVHVNHVGEIPLHPLGIISGTNSVGSLLPSQQKGVSRVSAYTVIFVGKEVDDWME